MPRSPSILQSQFPYHVGGRCINKEWFSLPMDDVWKIMTDRLAYCSIVYSAQIYSFVLMSNHFHLLMATPDANLDIIMREFMRETSRSLTSSSNRINQTYGGRYFRSMIGSQRYFDHVYKYVYLNPVRAGIVARAEDYKYSTLNGVLGFNRLTIPMVEDCKLFDGDIEANLAWINSMPVEKDLALIRRGLRKREFKLARDPDTKKPSRLEFAAL